MSAPDHAGGGGGRGQPTTGSVGPFSRPVRVDRLPAGNEEVVVTADADERAALARDFGLVAIHALEGRFRLDGGPRRLRVRGRVRAAIEQTCVVTLDPFGDEVDEEVDVDFSAADPRAGEGDEDVDAPDPIVDGIVDLGGLTAEFLALGLDPYPRKPGAAFAEPTPAEPDDHPLAALRGLAGRSDEA